MNTLTMTESIDSKISITWLKRTQMVTGMTFSVFIFVHLTNFMLAPFGVDTFNGYQQLARSIYQQPIIEILLVLLPLLTHITCTVCLLVIRHKTGLKRQTSLHAWAGLFLLLVIAGHVLAVRGPSFFYDVYPEFEGLSFSLWFFPMVFYPYYFLLALAGFYHASNGFRLGLNRFTGRSIKQVPASILVIVSAWFIVCLLALDGHFFVVPDPADSEFGKLYGEIMAMDTSVPWI